MSSVSLCPKCGNELHQGEAGRFVCPVHGVIDEV